MMTCWLDVLKNGPCCSLLILGVTTMIILNILLYYFLKNCPCCRVPIWWVTTIIILNVLLYYVLKNDPCCSLLIWGVTTIIILNILLYYALKNDPCCSLLIWAVTTIIILNILLLVSDWLILICVTCSQPIPLAVKSSLNYRKVDVRSLTCATISLSALPYPD